MTRSESHLIESEARARHARKYAFDVTVRLSGRRWEKRAEIAAQLAGLAEEMDLGIEFMSVSYLFDGGWSVTCWPPEDVEQLSGRRSAEMDRACDEIEREVKEIVERVLDSQEAG